MRLSIPLERVLGAFLVAMEEPLGFQFGGSPTGPCQPHERRVSINGRSTRLQILQAMSKVRTDVEEDSSILGSWNGRVGWAAVVHT